jgi:hypothetical protein
VLPQILMFCAMPTRKFYGPFFFHEDTVTGTSYFEKLLTWFFLKLHEDEPEDFIWQEDRDPPHFFREVCRWLNDVLPHRWIGRDDRGDLNFCPWPALCYYFLWS